MTALDLTVLKVRCDGGRSIAPARLEHEDRDGVNVATVQRDLPDKRRGYGIVATVDELMPARLELVVKQVAVADAASGRYLPQRLVPDADQDTAKVASRIDLTEDNPFTRQTAAACPCGSTVLLRRSDLLAAIAEGTPELVLPHQRH